MFCPHCGHTISDDADFCGACGKKIEKRTAAEPTGTDGDTAASTLPTKKKKLGKLPLLVAGAVALVAVVGFAVLHATSSPVYVMTEYCKYDESGELESRTVYELDDAGNITKATVYDENDEVSEVTEYTVGSDGAPTSSITKDSDGDETARTTYKVTDTADNGMPEKFSYNEVSYESGDETEITYWFDYRSDGTLETIATESELQDDYGTLKLTESFNTHGFEKKFTSTLNSETLDSRSINYTSDDDLPTGSTGRDEDNNLVHEYKYEYDSNGCIVATYPKGESSAAYSFTYAKIDHPSNWTKLRNQAHLPTGKTELTL